MERVGVAGWESADRERDIADRKVRDNNLDTRSTVSTILHTLYLTALYTISREMKYS